MEWLAFTLYALGWILAWRSASYLQAALWPIEAAYRVWLLCCALGLLIAEKASLPCPRWLLRRLGG